MPENSALRVLEIATELDEMPDPASRGYQPLWMIWQMEPVVRPGPEQVAALRSQVGPFQGAVAKARAAGRDARGTISRAPGRS